MSEMFFGVNPEKLREHHNRHQMFRQQGSHDIRDFLDSLDKDQLETLKIIVSACDDQQTSFWYIGRVQEILHYKFDVCPCGQPHGEMPEDFVDQGPEVPVGLEDIETILIDPEEQAEMEEETREPMLTEDALRLMDEYGIEEDPRYPVAEWDSTLGPAPQPFRCINCGQGYASLADRMARPPKLDGCSGCQRKSALG